MRDLASADFVLSLRSNLVEAVAAGVLTSEVADAWWEALEERDRAGAFFASLNGVMVGATRK